MILMVLIFVSSICFLVKYISSAKKTNGIHKSLYDIPCPDGLPIIGNMTDFFLSDDDLWKKSRGRALNYFPIYRLRFGGQNMVSLLDPEDIEIILSNTKSSIKGPIYNTLRGWTGNGLVVSEGEIWQKRRKFLTKSFHFGVLREYMKIFNKRINYLIEYFEKECSEPVAVLSPITHMTLSAITEAIFGEKLKLKQENMEEYAAAIKTMTGVISYKSTRPYIDFLYNISNMKKNEDKALNIIHNFSNNLLKDYSALGENEIENNQKILDIMLKNPDIFDEKGIMDEINTFTFGGHDTTSRGLTFVLLALANYPQYQEELYQEILGISGKKGTLTHAEISEMVFLDRFLKECLRLFPPVVFIARELQENIITKTGYELPGGTFILINIFDVHRNSNLFPDPEIFDPDRFLLDNIAERHPFAYIPFSAGPRNCIAQKFAMLELKASVCKILQKFILEPGDRMEDIIFVNDTILHTKNKIKVKFVPRV